MESFTSTINYNDLINQSLRGVVRSALEITEKQGSNGENHFYITFKTNAPGVDLPQMLKIQYPESMTIVLQHQYSDLKVGTKSFSVVLVFGGVPYKLSIPFASITYFADPYAKFGLSFEDTEQTTEAQQNSDLQAQSAEIISIDSFRKKK